MNLLDCQERREFQDSTVQIFSNGHGENMIHLS